MTQLDRGLRPFGVHGLGERAQARKGFLSHPDLVREGAPRTRDRAVGEGRHPDSAGGEEAVPLDQAFGNEPSAGQTLVRPALDHPVPELDLSQPSRGEEGFHHEADLRPGPTLFQAAEAAARPAR